MSKPTLGVSPITGTIYAGKTKQSKLAPGLMEWTGTKHDVTDEVVRCMLEHMMHLAKSNGEQSCGYTFPEFGTIEFTFREQQPPM